MVMNTVADTIASIQLQQALDAIEFMRGRILELEAENAELARQLTVVNPLDAWVESVWAEAKNQETQTIAEYVANPPQHSQIKARYERAHKAKEKTVKISENKANKQEHDNPI